MQETPIRFNQVEGINKETRMRTAKVGIVESFPVATVQSHSGNEGEPTSR